MADIAFQQAVRLFEQGRLTEAEKPLLRYAQRNPRDPDALHLLGIIAQETGRSQRAVSLIGKAIALNPGAPPPYDSLANALHDLGRDAEALAACDKAIALDPRFVEALVNRGNILFAMKRHTEALASHDRAIALAPGFAEAHFNRALALCELGRREEALAACDTAIALRPDFPDVHFTRGNILNDERRYREALACFQRVIVLKPDHAEAWYNIGNVYLCLFDYENAVENFDRAVQIKRDHAGAWLNRGVALFELARYKDALASYEETLRLTPEREFLYGDAIQVELTICRWAGLDGKIAALVRGIERGDKICDPFTALTLLSDPSMQRHSAAIYAAHKYRPDRLLPDLPRHAHDGKIRIGYFSADFRQHPVADLMLGLFENHDRSRFHLTGFAFGPDSTDKTTERVAAALGEFIDIRKLSDSEAALLAREKQIDIAVDLGGYTKHCRPGIFALRAAPVQVNYIGFLGTLGVDHIDYIFADAVIVPTASREHYAEKIAYLPSYQSNPAERPVLQRVLTRSACGLPDNGFVFCCFNNTFKILPDVFASWIRIVMATPGSVLWLYVSNPTAADNLRSEAGRLGLDSTRLILAERVERAEYLARLALADLFLDTLPYNAGTTASDALWTGLPVLTRIGETFAGRVAASVLTAIGLTDLIVSTAADYERIAIELGNDPAKLADAKRRLERNRHTELLFDAKRFAASIEAAYVAMHERYRAGLPPDHLLVDS